MTSTYTLTPETLEIFKNFAAINPQAVFLEGHAQRACNPSRNFIADIELADPLPRECAVYELNKLLGVIDTTKGTSLPSLRFDDNSLTITHDHGHVTIPYAHPDVVAKPPANKFAIAQEIASFDLPASLWTKIKRVASVLQTTSMHIIVTEEGKLEIKLINDKDKGGSSTGWGEFTFPNTIVSSATPNTWAVRFDSLEFIPGDYKVVAGEIGTAAKGAATLFGIFFTLDDPKRKVSYLTSGHLVKNTR